jgi:hypothetical protein
MRCNESGWLPGQTRDVANDSAARRVRRGCGAGRAALTRTAGDAPDATGCTRLHRDASRRNDDARRATASASSSLHQIQVDHEVPGHHSRTALRQAEGRRNAARCAAGSACSREVPNVASDATPRPCNTDVSVCRTPCGSHGSGTSTRDRARTAGWCGRSGRRVGPLLKCGAGQYGVRETGSTAPFSLSSRSGSAGSLTPSILPG